MQFLFSTSIYIYLSYSLFFILKSSVAQCWSHLHTPHSSPLINNYIPVPLLIWHLEEHNIIQMYSKRKPPLDLHPQKQKTKNKIDTFKNWSVNNWKSFKNDWMITHYTRLILILLNKIEGISVHIYCWDIIIHQQCNVIEQKNINQSKSV